MLLEKKIETRVRVNKAYKMFVGGAFVRSESGRYFQVQSNHDKSADPETVNIPSGSRKDARDAVLAAKSALPGWSKRTAYNRGQILYRLAEVLESRRSELAQSLERAGASIEAAKSEVDETIDRAVYYAGFCDKIASLVASYNPVAGPHFAFTVPEPVGVVAIVLPSRPTLLGLVSTIAPVIASGNVCVAVAGQPSPYPLPQAGEEAKGAEEASDPRTAILFCECVATSDVPPGVVNVLTGDAKEIAPHLATHREVNAIDAWSPDAEFLAALAAAGAGSVKRVHVHADAQILAGPDGQGIGPVERFLEFKTVWHPVGV